ncbi:MAG: archaemetzincin family Zn-dependent metalloprotease [Deltaproteobacteria bacterium]|nr:archaemetzincin family Zn-dependent metalloprotease [Deltaproteobacteria bacterium]
MPSHVLGSELSIISLGDTPKKAEQRACLALKAKLELNCKIALPGPLPESAFDQVREQYDALKLLASIEDMFPIPNASKGRGNERKILAITSVDLFIPVLTFVFGAARLGGRSAIISAYRLYEEFYGRPQDNELLLSRIEKEAIHEVGHLLDLTHCLDRNCVMHASNCLADTDVKSTGFCPRCHSLLAC